MNVYYQSLMEELDGWLGRERYSLAQERIQEELKIPYVPKDALDALKERLKTCEEHTAAPKPADVNRLDQWIAGTAVQQEMAAAMLCGLNLRQHRMQVQKLLDSADLLPEYKGQLIEALMEQRLDVPFSIVKDGLEITFLPASIIPSCQDKTLVQARRLFDAWFASREPAMEQFCLRLLEQEVLEMRPFDFQELEAASLAKRVAHMIHEAMGREEDWKAFEQASGLQQTEEYILTIERQGEN